MQAPCSDVLGALVHLEGNLRDLGDAILCEADLQILGAQQCLVLLREGAAWLRENALEVMGREGTEFHANGQAPLQFGNQVGGLGEVESAGRDEQDVVRLHAAVLGGNGGAFDQRQQIALHAFSRDAAVARVIAHGDLVDLVDEDDAGLFGDFNRLAADLLFIDKARGFFVAQQLEGGLDGQATGLRLAAVHVREHALELAGHFLETGRGHDLDARDGIGHLDLDLAIIQFAFAQFLAEDLPGGRIGALLVRRAVLNAAGRRQQGVEDAVLGGVLGDMLHFAHLFFAQHLHRHVDQVANDGVHIAAHIANLRELGGLDLDEGRIGESGQTARDLGLADAGRADHENVLGGDLRTNALVELHAAPAIAQGDGHSALGGVLANDVTVQFGRDFSRGHAGHWSELQFFNSVVLVGIHADVCGDDQAVLNDAAGIQIGVPVERAGC